MNLDKHMPVKFTAKSMTVVGSIFGGPFRNYEPGTRRLVGIKMAKEINHPHEMKVDTEDFNVPEPKDMRDGILYGIRQLFAGNDLYVGCMGGIGRTGLYMACMAKVMKDYYAQGGGGDYAHSDLSPVQYVRRYYLPHAVETKTQKQYVEDFDTAPALALIKELTRTHVTVRVVTNEVIVYRGPFDWMKDKFEKWFVGI